MTSNNESNGLKELTQCSICYSSLLQPKILPCGHTFCCNCVKRLCEIGLNRTFDCPECRVIHCINQEHIPTDFKLKQMMHTLTKDRQLDCQNRNKICSNCAACGDIKNYFICNTCSKDDEEYKQVYCSLCIVKKHQLHEVTEVLEEAKHDTRQAIDRNTALINQLIHNINFYRNRYELQNVQIVFIFQMFLTFCERTKETIDEEFTSKHTQMTDLLSTFLEKIQEVVNRVFNESDNAIFQLCEGVITSFAQTFDVSSSVMLQLKSKILNNERFDLFSFLLNLTNDDDLSNRRQQSSSNDSALSFMLTRVNEPNMTNHLSPHEQDSILQTSPSSFGNFDSSAIRHSSNVFAKSFGRKVYLTKKRR